MLHFCRHADALVQRGVRVNRPADIDGVSAHLGSESHRADRVAANNALLPNFGTLQFSSVTPLENPAQNLSKIGLIFQMLCVVRA